MCLAGRGPNSNALYPPLAAVGRCLDILYGACVVSKCRLTRVSRDTLYIIAPADVKLAAFDGLRRMGEQDIQLNWPYPDNGGFTSSFGGVQANYRTVGGYQNAR